MKQKKFAIPTIEEANKYWLDKFLFNGESTNETLLFFGRVMIDMFPDLMMLKDDYTNSNEYNILIGKIRKLIDEHRHVEQTEQKQQQEFMINQLVYLSGDNDYKYYFRGYNRDSGITSQISDGIRDFIVNTKDITSAS